MSLTAITDAAVPGAYMARIPHLLRHLCVLLVTHGTGLPRGALPLAFALGPAAAFLLLQARRRVR